MGALKTFSFWEAASQRFSLALRAYRDSEMFAAVDSRAYDKGYIGVRRDM